MLGDDSAIGGLDTDRVDALALFLLDIARNARNGAAGADAGDKDVNGTIGVIPDLGPGGAEVDLGIGGVFELLQEHVALWIAGYDLFGLGDRATHAFSAVGKDKVGAERLEDFAPFDRHGFRHGESNGIATGSGDKGKRDSGVTAGRFDQFFAGIQDAAFLGVPDHRGSDAALD